MVTAHERDKPERCLSLFISFPPAANKAHVPVVTRAWSTERKTEFDTIIAIHQTNVLMMQFNKETSQEPALHKGSFSQQQLGSYRRPLKPDHWWDKGGWGQENVHHDNAAQQQLESITSLIVILQGH